MGQGRRTAKCFKSGTGVFNELQEAAQSLTDTGHTGAQHLHDPMAEPRHGSYTTPNWFDRQLPATSRDSNKWACEFRHAIHDLESFQCQKTVLLRSDKFV